MAVCLSILFFAPAAGAEIVGPCTGNMNGVDVNSLSSPGTALQAPYNGSVSVSYSSSSRIASHEVQLEFVGGVPWTVARGQDDGNSWSETVTVADYSRYGVGLYRVTAGTFGEATCSGAAFVRVTGKSPLTTAAGAGAAAAAAVGAIGMAGSAVANSRKGSRMADKAQEASIEEEVYINGPYIGCFGCLLNAPMAMLQTVAFMVSGAGGPGVAAPALRWRPYLSVSSVVSSLLAGLGTLVLMQQFAVFFPTVTISVLWLAGWLVLGIGIPSLGRIVSVRQANAILRERARLAQGKRS